jgi:hypothetical protein
MRCPASQEHYRDLRNHYDGRISVACLTCPLVRGGARFVRPWYEGTSHITSSRFLSTG